MLDYTVMADNESMYNTPPCYTMYMCGLVFEKLLAEGGLAGMEQRNIKKAQLVYDAIASSGGFYVCPVRPASLSLSLSLSPRKPRIGYVFGKGRRMVVESGAVCIRPWLGRPCGSPVHQRPGGAGRASEVSQEHGS
jgi:hypothetical protein